MAYAKANFGYDAFTDSSRLATLTPSHNQSFVSKSTTSKSSKEEKEVQGLSGFREDLALREYLLKERALAVKEKYIMYMSDLLGEEDISLIMKGGEGPSGIMSAQ